MFKSGLKGFLGKLVLMEQKELSKAKLFYVTSFKVGALYEALKIEIIVNNQQPMRKKEWLMMSLKSRKAK